MKRVTAQIRFGGSDEVDPQIMEARLVLNDMTSKRLSFFCPERLTMGEEIAITLEYPKRMFLKGSVMACAEVESSGKIISIFQANYRVTASLQFDSPEAEANVDAFIKELIASNFNPATSKNKAA